MTKEEFTYEIAHALAAYSDCGSITPCLKRNCAHMRQATAITETLWPIVERMVDAVRPPPSIPPGTMIEETMPNGLKAYTMK